jgi:hypothetical protein
MMVMACYGMLWHAGLGCKVPGGDGSERGAGGAKHCRFMCQTCFAYVSHMFRILSFQSSFQSPRKRASKANWMAPWRRHPRSRHPFAPLFATSAAPRSRQPAPLAQLSLRTGWYLRLSESQGAMMDPWCQGFGKGNKTQRRINMRILQLHFFNFFLFL